MLRLTTHGFGKFAIYSILLSSPPDCSAKYEYVFHRFALPTCPPASFSLPKSVNTESQQLTRDERQLWPTTATRLCRGFIAYEPRDWRGERLLPAGQAINVRLNRGASCSLDVGYVDTPSSQSSKEWAEVAASVARLAMQEVGISPSSSPERTERLAPSDDLRAWCARTAMEAGIPCVSKLRLADGGVPARAHTFR